MTDDLSPHLTDLVDDAVPGEVPPFGAVVARRRRRRTTRLAIGATAVAVAAVAIGVPAVLAGGPDTEPSPAPATQSPTDATDPTDPTTQARPDLTYEWANRPAPVVLRLADRDVELDGSGCWHGPADPDGMSSGRCTDGFIEDADLEPAGSPESVDFWFGRPGWRFDASFVELGVQCPRSFTVPVEATGDRTFRIDPAGPPGHYRVGLFGRGPEGSVYTNFAWDTPTAGPTDPPRATIALVTDAGDDLTSYGLEISVQDLAEQPESASVEVTATAANGRSMNLTAPWEDQGDRCNSRGSLFFQDDDPSGVADLGPAPFTYEVVLTLDGEEYVGTAVWPRDETRNEAPNTVLTFDPPLPAYTID